MSGPYAGKAASFYSGYGTSTARTGNAMTRVGSTWQFYITDRTKAWWDPNQPVVVYDNATPVTGCHIDYAGGYVTLPASHTIVTPVTVNCYTIPMECIGGGHGWNISKKGNAIEDTSFAPIAGSVTDRTYIGGLCDWTGSVKRHYWYACASFTTNIGTANAELTWTWKTNGSFGNLEHVAYTSGGALAVSRVGNTTTVTYVVATTLASDIKAFVEADSTLKGLWDISYPIGNDGSGKVGTVTSTLLTGGRDSLEDLAKVATKVMCVFYLDTTTAVSERLEGVAIMTNLNVNDPIESIVDADLDFQGTDVLNYHSS